MRQSGLPGSPWLVAGTTSHLAAMIASADLRKRKLWLPGAGEWPVYAIGPAQENQEPVIPAGYRLSESPIDDHLLLVREDPAPTDCREEDIREEIESSGYKVSGIETVKADAELGAAALAAVGSGLLKSWERYYKLLARPPAAVEEEQGADGSPDTAAGN